jgi:chromosome segregation ATPase
MIGAETRDVRVDLRRWIEDGPNQFGVLLGLLHDHDRLRERVETVDAENERLRGLAYECEQLKNRLEASERQADRLREEVARLRSLNEAHLSEREEVAEQLSTIMNTVLLRLRPNQG